MGYSQYTKSTVGSFLCVDTKWQWDLCTEAIDIAYGGRAISWPTHTEDSGLQTKRAENCDIIRTQTAYLAQLE